MMDINEILINCIKNKEPIAYCKYGDGEYYCATGVTGANCDQDGYSKKKGDNLMKSLKYMVTCFSNTYIGQWNDNVHNKFWTDIVDGIKWANYHTFIIDKPCDPVHKVRLYREIKESKLKKIYVCNMLMKRAEILLDVNIMVYVPLSNWYDTCFDEVMNKIENSINGDEQCIVMTSAGLASKILIAELATKFPRNLYFDIGSGLDKICTKKNSRGYEYEYDELVLFFKDLIPEHWEDSKYDYIFKEANTKIGIHL